MRGRRARWLILCAAGAVVIVGLIVLLVTREDDATAPPEASDSTPPPTVIDPAELPPADHDEARATLDYLDGDGAALLVLVEVAESPSGNLDGPACADAKARLSAAGSPAELSTLTVPVVDEVTRAALESTRVELVSLLHACQGGADDADARLRASRAAALFRQRIGQLQTA